MDAPLKTVAYLRVSTQSQDLATQKLAILEFSRKRRVPIDHFIEVTGTNTTLTAAVETYFADRDGRNCNTSEFIEALDFTTSWPR